MKKMMIGIVAVSLLSSCTQVAGWFGKNSSSDSTQVTQKTENQYVAKARDESITKENAYSDLFLDSNAVENFIKAEKLPDSSAGMLRNFYAVRNNQFAWFNSSGLTEEARGLWSLYSSEKNKKNDDPAAKVQERIDTLLQKDSAQITSGDTSLARTELTLTAQLIQLASQNQGAINEESFYYLVPAKKQDPLQLADSLLHKQTDTAQYANYKPYNQLKAQLSVYYNAAKNGGWQAIPTSAKLKKGSKSPAVSLLKKRLQATNDYRAGDTTTIFSDTLATAVKEVQQRYGLLATGVVNDSLLQALNIPAQERVQQILVNLNRMLWMQPSNDSSTIQINIPTLMLVAYEGGNKTMEMPVIVGKEGNSTTAFSGAINQIVFSPEWHIPQSIVRNEIKPAMEKDPHYLEKHHMEVVKQNDSLPEIKQLPGKDNALGSVKFLFPNSFDIYLHDTPNKDLFAQKNRALSHGCIRVAHPDSLAHYLLKDQAEWTPDKIKTAMNSGKEQHVTVQHPQPVAITYFTAWTDNNGKLNFRNDIYGHDKEVASKLFTAKL